MADKKISQLTTLAQADVAVTADFLPIVDTSATETKKATPQALVQAGATGATLAVALGAVTTPSLTFTGDLNTGVWSPAADTLAASTGGSERLRVNSSGNVGIGTTNPIAPLVLSNAGAGGIEFTPTGGVGGGAYFNACNRSTSAFIPWTNYASAHTWYTSTAGSTRAMDLDSSGNLGIGTSSPGARLDVAGNAEFGANNQVMLGSATFAVNNASIWASVGRLDIGTTSAADVSVFANNTERLRIESSGSIRAGAAAALATTATDGFLYVPTCAGTPTGTPTAITGMAPIVVNTTNNKLYFYSGGAWRDAGP